jgi:adenylate cyclase
MSKSINLITHLIFTFSGLVAGIIYSIFADKLNEPITLFNGMLIGTIFGFLVSAFELYVFNPREPQFPFLSIVATKSLFYFLLSAFVTLGIKILNESLYYGQSFEEYLRGPRFRKFLYEEDLPIILIYILLLLGLTIFFKEINRKMGQGILLNFITGRYHKPREEERIFMFLDIKNSTGMAEKMGTTTYFEMLNNFFFDITSQVVKAKGIIYRYVGDQVVFSWKLENNKILNSNCIPAFFSAKKYMDLQRPKYLAKYGLFPDFRASIHGGKVIVGEIGDVKSQIVFLGEPMYVAGKIEKKCSEMGEDIMVSDYILDKIELPAEFLGQPVGTLELDFLDQPMKLYTIRKKEQELVKI